MSFSAAVQAVVDGFKDSVKSAISQGHIELTEDSFKIGADSSPNGKELTGPVLRVKVKNREGALALTEGKDEEIWDRFSKSINANLAVNARNALIAENQDPIETGLRKMARQGIKSGFPGFAGLSEDQVVENLRAQLATGK